MCFFMVQKKRHGILPRRIREVETTSSGDDSDGGGVEEHFDFRL